LECQSPHIHIIRFAFNDNKQKKNSLYRTVACKNDYSEEERERERERGIKRERNNIERGIERPIIERERERKRKRERKSVYMNYYKIQNAVNNEKKDDE
jgi:hypothetical protein